MEGGRIAMFMIEETGDLFTQKFIMYCDSLTRETEKLHEYAKAVDALTFGIGGITKTNYERTLACVKIIKEVSGEYREVSNNIQTRAEEFERLLAEKVEELKKNENEYK